MEDKKITNLENYLSYDDKLKLNSLNTSYNLKLNSSYLSLIGVNSSNLLNEFKTYFLEFNNTQILKYTNTILEDIKDYSKTYIIDIYNIENENIESVVQYFRFNRDYIPEHNIKIFILASFETLDLFSLKAYDFVTFNSFYGKFNDSEFKFDYEIDESKLDGLIKEFKELKPNTPKALQIEKMLDIAKESNNISKKNIELKYLNLALPKAKKLKHEYLIGSIFDRLGTYYQNIYNEKLALKNYNEALKIAQKIKNSDAQAKTLENIGTTYYSINAIEKAKIYYNKAKKISEQNNNLEGLQRSYNKLFLIYENSKEYDKALEYANKALDISNSLNNKEETSISLSSIGAIYSNIFRYIEAIKFYKKSLQIDKEINKKEAILSSLYNIAFIYQRLFDFKLSMKYLDELLLFNKNENNITIILSYSLLSLLNCNQLDFTSALKNISKALNIANKIDATQDKTNILLNLSDIYKYTDLDKCFQTLEDISKQLNEKENKNLLLRYGIYYLKTKEYNKALKFFNKSLKLFQEDKDIEYEIKTLYNIANVYIGLKQYDKAKVELDLAYDIANKINHKSSLVEIYIIYYDYYRQIKDETKSKEYYNKANYIIKNSNHKLFEKQLLDISSNSN